jgi:hypothetical protein
MADGLDISQLTDFEQDLVSTAVNIKNGREAKKFLKKEGAKLTKIQKKNLKYSGALAGSGESENEALKGLKTGKVYTLNGFNVRAYGGGLNNIWGSKGFIHKGGKDKTGEETWVYGADYINKSKEEFEEQYATDVSAWIDKLLEDGLL